MSLRAQENANARERLYKLLQRTYSDPGAYVYLNTADLTGKNSAPQ